MTNSSSSGKNGDAAGGSSSVLDSFSKFSFDGMKSLLPAKPVVAGEGDKSYVYPVDAFPPTSAFDVSTEFPALVLPVRRTHELRKKLKPIMLSRPRLSVVVQLSESDLDNGDKKDDKTLTLCQDNQNLYRKIVLDPEKAGLKQSGTDDNDENGTSTTVMNPDLKALLDEEPQSYRLGKHTIVLTYQDWTAEEILSRLLLPENVKEVPSAFEAVGHLAHVNLRDELLPYKYLVGKVLLDKNTPRIRTVVNKLGSIDNKFRTFGMEVIAGDDSAKDGKSWSDVIVKEEGCEYRLDFRKVYWNSRLGGEHRRLVKVIRKDALDRAQRNKRGEQNDTETNDEITSDTTKKSLVVADLMAGIGPFAIPLTARTNESNHPKKEDRGDTKKKNNNNKNQTANKLPPLPIVVYANDLNPSSYEYLVVNAKRNRCDYITNYDSMDSNGVDNKHKLYAYNMDARAFCHQLQDKGIFPDHCIMNLPAIALEFLDAFRGFPRGGELPRIHVHCFAPKDTQAAKQEIWKRVETALGCVLNENNDKVQIHPVRDVAPNKNMYCISFRLPPAASELPRIHLDAENHDQTEGNSDEGPEPDPKRRKTDE